MPIYFLIPILLILAFFGLPSQELCADGSGSVFVVHETAPVPQHQPQVSFASTPQRSNPVKADLEPRTGQLQQLASGFSAPAPQSRVPAPQQSSPIVQVGLTQENPAPTNYAFEPNLPANKPQPTVSQPVANPVQRGQAASEPEEAQTFEETTATEETGQEDNGVLDELISSPDKKRKKGKMGKPQFAGTIAPLVSVVGSLMMVLSIFLILAILFKKVSPKSNQMLPKDAFENLGRTFLTPKIQLHLVRLGDRLILLCVGADGVTPITEITDADEVVPLLALCRKTAPNSSTELFKKAIEEFSTDKSEQEYLQQSRGKRSRPVQIDSKPAHLDLYSEPGESLTEILASGRIK